MNFYSIAEVPLFASYMNFKYMREPECNLLGYDPKFVLWYQFKVIVKDKKYFLDFLQPDTKLAVEIDGIKWHRATAQQIEKDYERERNLVSAGYTVLRFVAKDAQENPTKCLAEIYKLYCRLNNEKTTIKWGND